MTLAEEIERDLGYAIEALNVVRNTKLRGLNARFKDTYDLVAFLEKNRKDRARRARCSAQLVRLLDPKIGVRR